MAVNPSLSSGALQPNVSMEVPPALNDYLEKQAVLAGASTESVVGGLSGFVEKEAAQYRSEVIGSGDVNSHSKFFAGLAGRMKDARFSQVDPSKRNSLNTLQDAIEIAITAQASASLFKDISIGQDRAVALVGLDSLLKADGNLNAMALAVLSRSSIAQYVVLHNPNKHDVSAVGTGSLLRIETESTVIDTIKKLQGDDYNVMSYVGAPISAEEAVAVAETLKKEDTMASGYLKDMDPSRIPVVAVVLAGASKRDNSDGHLFVVHRTFLNLFNKSTILAGSRIQLITDFWKRVGDIINSIAQVSIAA
jgi:hypothetical protein